MIDRVKERIKKRMSEGITSENVANLSTSFVDDVLAEYAEEIDSWLASAGDETSNRRVVHFY